MDNEGMITDAAVRVMVMTSETTWRGIAASIGMLNGTALVNGMEFVRQGEWLNMMISDGVWRLSLKILGVSSWPAGDVCTTIGTWRILHLKQRRVHRRVIFCFFPHMFHGAFAAVQFPLLDQFTRKSLQIMPASHKFSLR